MGHKVNPLSLRLIINKDWRAKWFGKKDLAQNILIDLQTRAAIQKKHGKQAGISKVDISRDNESIAIHIYTSKPGIIIGRSGQGINDLRAFIVKHVESFRTTDSNKLPKIRIEIIEVKNPETNAQLAAESIAIQIEKRIAYKRAIKQAISKAMEARVKGIKVQISGRLAGAEIARSEKYSQSSIPLSRLRADIDYGYAVALTTFGTIGIKVWIYKGDKILLEEKQS